MKLSACYIVGEYETDFEKSLKSIYNSVDELIVINTAKDKKVAVLAEKYGAKVYSFSWQNDFALARNFALKSATGDWILFLDADEYFKKELGDKLKQLIVLQGQTIDCFFIKIHNVDSDQENKQLDSFFAPRLFRNKQSIHYEGAIHEQLLEQGQPLRKYVFVKEDDIQIIHTGYRNSVVKKKAERNLKFLLAELQTTSQPETLYMPLAEAYEGVEDFHNAVYYAKLSIRQGRQAITYASRGYRILLRLMGDREDEFWETVRAAVQDFPELPEFHAEYARCLADKFAYKEAISEMKQAIACYQTGGFIEPSMFEEASLLLAVQLIERWQDMQVFERTLRLSACAIAKNEEAEINRWIENMKRCTDEQILVDTGSTDRTVAIAEAAGIKVYHYSWQDDFSAVRNFALEQATGDWIVFLDIDEYFTEESLQYVRQVIAREHWRKDEVDAIMCPLINIDIDQESREVNRFLNLRLLRNEPYLRYMGNVHESVRNSEGKLKILQEQKYLQIYHTGYSSERLQRKVQRDLDLLLRDIEKKGESEEHYRYLSDCYRGLGDYEKAVRYAKMHLESNAFSIGCESGVFRNLIYGMQFLGATETEKQEYIEKAIETFPDLPDFYVYYGNSLLAENRREEAKENFIKSLDIEMKMKGRVQESSDFPQLRNYVYRQLIRIAVESNDEVGLNDYIVKALGDDLYNEELFSYLHFFLKKKPFLVIIEVLRKYYGDEQTVLQFIAEQWGKYQLDEVYFHYKERLEKEYGVADEEGRLLKLLIEGKVNEAFQQGMAVAVEQIKLLTYVLLKDPSLLKVERVKLLLPESFLHCVEVYHGMRQVLSRDDFDGYMALLSCMQTFNDSFVLHDFCRLADEFKLEQMALVAESLYRQDYWSEAMVFYKKILMASLDYEPDLFRFAGICAFRCGDFIAAKKYLVRAKELSGSESKEIDSYLYWMLHI